MLQNFTKWERNSNSMPLAEGSLCELTVSHTSVGRLQSFHSVVLYYPMRVEGPTVAICWIESLGEITGKWKICTRIISRFFRRRFRILLRGNYDGIWSFIFLQQRNRFFSFWFLFCFRNVMYGARNMLIMCLTHDCSPFPEMRNPERMCSGDPSPIWEHCKFNV